MSAMGDPADALIETDEAALAQVRRDLAQTYTRFMARMLAESLASRGGDGSMLDRLAGSAPEPQDG